LRPSSFVMCNTPVEVQFTSAGCLNYPCRTPLPACLPAEPEVGIVRAAATYYRVRKDRLPPSPCRVVETSAMPVLISLTFFAELGKLG
jgi:hypothetical protein